MKHIKTYKIFENYSKSPEEICEEIEEILIPLSWNKGNKLEVKVDIDNDRDAGTLIYLRITDDWLNKIGFNLVDYENEFKQLFSTLDEEGWYLDYENRPYHKTNDFIRYPYVELTEAYLICPECGSDEISPASSDRDETEYKCYNCNHKEDHDGFKKYLLRIEEESMFFEFIKRDLDKIFIRFIKN